MILINFKDGQGLGNQFWLLFTAIYLSKKLNRELKIRNFNKFKGKTLISNKLIKEFKSFNRNDFEKQWTVIEPYPFIDSSNNEKIYFQENKDFIEIINLYKYVEISGNFQSNSLLLEPKETRKYFKDYTYCYENYSTRKKNICIINIRGGDYLGIKKSPCVEITYFLNAMEYIRNLLKDVKFFIVTDDYDYANIILPKVEIIKGNLEDDFKHLYLSKYLILSNSSFAYFPTFISQNLKLAIAPYRWAASNKNIKSKIWYSPQNFSKRFIFMGNNGEIYSNLNYFKVSYHSNKKIIPSIKKFIYPIRYSAIEDKNDKTSKNKFKKIKRFILLQLWKLKKFRVYKKFNKKNF